MILFSDVGVGEKFSWFSRGEHWQFRMIKNVDNVRETAVSHVNAAPQMEYVNIDGTRGDENAIN